MGISRGSVTFSRYCLIGQLPDRFTEFCNERLRKNAFQNFWRTAEEKAVGWTALEDPLDTDFSYASYAQGRYLPASVDQILEAARQVIEFKLGRRQSV